MKLVHIAIVALVTVALIACRASALAGDARGAQAEAPNWNTTAGDAPTSPVPPGNSSRAVRPPGSGAVLSLPHTDTPTDWWRVYYFATAEPASEPLSEGRLFQPYLDAHWLDALPDDELAAQALSSVWVRDIDLKGGALRFYIWADGGVRLTVNGRLVIDRWDAAGDSAVVGDLWLDRAGPTEVLLVYRPIDEPGRIKLWWERTTWFTGWRGEYYSNRYLTGQPTIVRNDAVPVFDWGLDAPASGLPADNFSVRWTRDVMLEPGCYRFTAEADDGVRLYVGEMLLINAWQESSISPLVREVWLSGGEHTITIEYFDAEGAARVAVNRERLDAFQGGMASPQDCGAPAALPVASAREAAAGSDLLSSLRQALRRLHYHLAGPPIWW
jgi:hypothetical protein